MADENTKSKKTISWNKQIKPLFKIIDALERGDEEAAMAVKRPEELEADIAAMGEAPMGEAPMDEAPMDENAEGVDLSPLEAIVGGPEAAARIWEASRQRDDLAAMTPQELADAIETDFQLLMELEKLAAKDEGGEEMPMEEMPPDMMAAGPDMGMGAPAGGPPMGPGGPGGMLPGGY